MIREQDTRLVLSAVNAGECASIIGLSNMGKSALMRQLCESVPGGEGRLFVYVDCNLMPERSERALHEIVLRSAIELLQRVPAPAGLLERLDGLYQQVVDPPTPLRSPLAFNDAVTALCQNNGGRRGLVVALDEFDDPFEKLDGRVFLNLRAMKDRFGHRLAYVTATERRLADIRADREAGEFVELFASCERWIGFLAQPDAAVLAAEYAADDGLALQPEETAFVVRQAGGHPGLLQGVVQVFGRVAAGAPKASQREAQSVAARAFDGDPIIRQECVKLWSQFSVPEREALMAWAAHDRPAAADLSSLRAKGVMPDNDEGEGAGDAEEGEGEGESQGGVVGEVWRAYVKRQSLAHHEHERGVRVDVDAGDVFVDGRPAEQLTELEYKLLLLLYGRLNKIVDKFTIVTQVWGENYLDAVDDARIEKLVSRLRAKLEPGVEEPRYVATVRGRGYKLVG